MPSTVTRRSSGTLTRPRGSTSASAIATALRAGRLARLGYKVIKNAANKGKGQVNKSTAKQSGNDYTLAARSGATTRLASKKSNLKDSYKRPKNVKVSKNLRKKVKEVMKDEEARVAGTYSSYDTPLVIRPETADKKLFIAYPHYQKNDGTTKFQMYQMGELFSPNFILDAASKMYKDKDQNEDKSVFATTNFSPTNFFTNVTYNKATFWLKNNMNRTVRIKMYLCKSRTLNATNDQNSNPVELFSNLCDTYDQDTTDTNAPKCFHGLDFSSIDNGSGTTSYRNDPRFYPTFNKHWAVETVDFVMEPGQTTTQVVHGPTGEFNMLDHMTASSETGLTYNVNPKGAVYCMWSIMTDPAQVAANASTVGKLSYYVANNSESSLLRAVMIECERVIKMKVPERTLRDYPAAYVPDLGGTKGERTLVLRPRVFHEEYYGTTEDTVRNRLDEQQPLG